MWTEMSSQIAFVATAGVVSGLWLLVRGMTGYRDATRIGDTATSRIASVAAGEVQVSGSIEAAELTLVSPLQSASCVYYRSTIDEDDGDGGVTSDFREERAVGFKVRDASGDIRVFPRGARWDAPVVLDDATGLMGDEPAGLWLRSGSPFAAAIADREAAIAALLSFQPAGTGRPFGMGSGRRRRYREARLGPGDTVTIIGRALPFGDLADPAEADVAAGTAVGDDDPEVAGDIAEARAAGTLADSPQEAWGNAAIPGFGIGRPVRVPTLDPAANVPTLAPAGEAAASDRRFAIAPETLVLASAPDMPLLIVHGRPDAAAGRHEGRFIVGLLGAALAIGSAMVLAVTASTLLGT